MHQSWLDLDPDYINLHNMQIAFHFSAHFNLIDSDNYQQGHDFFSVTLTKKPWNMKKNHVKLSGGIAFQATLWT